ncbi:MAG: TIGR04141 family sporadically distributed protein, partial [bacterium]|nr:TIGR04141 family sporadically distributed protein [bacterium]
MKINVFKIPKENVEPLKQKIKRLEMANKYVETTNGWVCTFYLSAKPEVDDISWVKDFETTVVDISKLKNIIHFAIYLCVKGGDCFALTYGKSHFYVRKFCDIDFGLEMAKRIADENDVKQKASKRFSGKKKKEIKSFVKNTKLDNESGESVDYISAAITQDKQVDFGEKSKFGSSLIVSREDLIVSKIPDVLDVIIRVLDTEKPRFDLPKTFEIRDSGQIVKYTNKLLEQIKNDISSIETEDSSYDLVGTDFVFYLNEKYTFHFGHKKSQQISELSHTELKKFIDENSIPDNEILNIKVEITNENNKTYTRPLYEM